MEAPSSPFRLSPGSTCSSSLIMTPAPISPIRGPLPKGPLQPHITNLPRRHKVPPSMRNITIPAVPTPPSSSASSPSTYAQTPIQLPTLPFPISAGGIPQKRVVDSDSQCVSASFPAARGPVQPSHANVPRRVRGLTEAQLRAKTRRERCVQELGHASGVFVAFDWEDDDEEVGAVVRVVPASSSKWCNGNDKNDDVPGDVDDKGGGGTVLRVVSSGNRDDGVPCLKRGQLRDICAFVDKHRAEGRRVAITAPRSHAADALSAGVCSVFRDSADHGAVNDDLVEEKPLHRLVMRWHDLPSPDEDGEDDEDFGGLIDAWRGLLSRQGMDYLAAALAQDAPTPPS